MAQKEEEEVESELDLDNIDSEEFEVDSDDAKDPNGFIFSHNLDTFKKSKRERIKD